MVRMGYVCESKIIRATRQSYLTVLALLPYCFGSATLLFWLCHLYDFAL